MNFERIWKEGYGWTITEEEDNFTEKYWEGIPSSIGDVVGEILSNFEDEGGRFAYYPPYEELEEILKRDYNINIKLKEVR